MTQRATTKRTAKRQTLTGPEKLKRIKQDVAKYCDKDVANKLIAKYGVDCAYTLVRECMQRPAKVIGTVDAVEAKKIYKTKDVIKYFADKEVSNEKIAKGIGKTTSWVEKSRISNNAETASKTEKFNTRVDKKKETQAPKNKTNAPAQSTPVKTQGQVKSTATMPPNPFQTVAAPDLLTLSQQAKVNPFQAYMMPTVNIALTPQQQAEETYEQLTAKHKGNLSIEELMKESGVNSADIKAVFGRNKEYLTQLQPGKTNRTLASMADKVQGSCQGNCLAGVQRMCPVLDGQSPNWPKKEYNSSSNSACNGHIVLDKSNKYVTISVENKAYGKNAGSPEEVTMQKFNKSLPAGTIASLDNKKRGELLGRRAPSNASEIHGHIWVQDNKHRSCSDGVQPNGPQFSRYGKTMFVSVAKDCTVPKEIAMELIKTAQERQRAEKNKVRTNVAQRNTGRA